jgi:hypothetical protein
MLDLRLQRARNTLAQPGEKGLLRRIEADGSQAVRQGVAAAGQLHHLLTMPASYRNCSSAPSAGRITNGLNSNKGTKSEMGFYLRPFRPWSSALFATLKTVSLWSASFGGLIPTVSCSFSSEKSYSPSRLMCCQETAEPLATASRNASRLAASSLSSSFCSASIV